VLRAVLSLLMLGLMTSDVVAQSNRLEPGQAEARQRTAAGKLISDWTHPATELRGVWLASRDMLRPKQELAQMLDAIKAANFNLVLIDTLFRGYVAWPGSEHLPQYPGFEGEDVFAWLIEQCHQRGLRAGAWMEYGFYAYFTANASTDPSMGPILDRHHPELLSINFDGERYIHRDFGDFYSLCPSNPKSHQILAQIMASLVSPGAPRMSPG
jgi:uncharacterized lipoprotein YddW (UPF0748 family)